MNASSFTLDISLAGQAERRNVLRRCLARRHQTPVELERQVSAFLEYARALSIDLNHLWICRSGAREAAACACIRSPGRTAMLLLPSGLVQAVDARATRAMLGRISTTLLSSGVRLIQVLVEHDDDTLRQILVSEQFEEVALLRYLELPLEQAPLPVATPRDLAPDRFLWLDYSRETHPAFARAIQESYTDSLDCPSLSRLRDVEDVIEGHKSTGLFRPDRWKLLVHDGDAVGCALIAEHPLRPMAEVVYMGVLPAFRNRNVARYLLGTMLRNARQDGLQAATLAVDSANNPGRKLYAHFGFRESTTRRALILHSGRAALNSD